jgi:transposase-like protein
VFVVLCTIPRLMRTSFLGKVHVMPSKYDPETRAKAVRLVREHREDYPSEWAAITAVSKRLGMNAETLRNWIRQQQVDEGDREGVSSAAAAEIRALKRRNAELEQTIEILKAATSFFVGESDPRNRR